MNRIMFWIATAFSISSRSLGRWFQFPKCWDAHIVSSPWMSCISLFPLLMSEQTFAQVLVVTTTHLHCREIWFLYLSGKSCYRTTWWSFQFFSLDCGLTALLFHSDIEFIIFISSVLLTDSVCHTVAEQPLQKNFSWRLVPVHTWDEMFSSNLNVTLWMLMITSRV